MPDGYKRFMTMNSIDKGEIFSNKAKDLGTIKLLSLREISTKRQTGYLLNQHSLFHIFRRFIGDFKQATEMIKFQENLKNIKKKFSIDAFLKTQKQWILFLSNLGLHEHDKSLKKYSTVHYVYHRTKLRILNYHNKIKDSRGSDLLSKQCFFGDHNYVREIANYNNSTPKQMTSIEVDLRIIDVPFIIFKDYCYTFEFDTTDFLKGYNEGIVRDIKRTMMAHIIDENTIIPILFFNPIHIIDKHIGKMEYDNTENSMKAKKDVVIVFMDLMSSFTEFIQYLIVLNNR